ncbi:MarR family transcriptional regulator [Planosporangium sp. 12N6]|uniref:MarR family transcriptional regulator n=1 Tax=Planosporangium spinosum TaxID=3402278 RepID=UPI003CE7EC76
MTAPTTTPAAETVARTLTAYPDGITARDLAAAAGVGNSTAAKILAAMETAGTATRTAGTANGNRKAADIWRPATATATATEEATVTTTDETTAADDASPATDETSTADDAAPATGETSTADDAAPVTLVEAPVSGAPVSGAPSGTGDHLKIVMVAGVLGDHPDGVSAADVVEQSGLRAAVVARVLTAMEVAGAAVRKPADGPDGADLWIRGEADLSTVDLANAAPYRECVCTCGHRHRVRTGVAVTTRRTGRTTGEINSDGSAKLGKNGLRNLVEAFMRDLGPGHDVTPGTVGRELGGRSSGACGNAMEKLVVAGVLVLTSEAPVKYALADDAPAPTAEVAALMARPVISDDDTPASTDDAPATDEAATTADAPTIDEAPAELTAAGR